MEILRIKFDNIGIFKDGLMLDFTSKDRVPDKTKVNHITGYIYTQKLIALVGINASGKSTALKLIKFAMDMLLGHKNLDQRTLPTGILKNNTIISIDFFYEDKFYRIESKLKEFQNIVDDEVKSFCYDEEKIYQKKKSRVKSRNDLFKYSEEDIIHTREEFEKHEFSMLKPQDSIVIAISKNASKYYSDTIKETNINYYSVKGKANIDCINLFDNSIASLDFNDDNLEICFKDDKNAYECNNKQLGHDILSSGTIKGGNLIHKANLALKKGGYLLIDEIEIHMHKELVLTIIDFFNDIDINRKGATLIFTTHYAEILDSIERKDNIYILLKDKNHSCKAIRYSDQISRNDLKKSEVFLSNYIDGTAPTYESIEKVRKFLCQN